ncbi:hypothetical protein BDP81DRAFT_11762 [Colletotrichum phormii]|uniref:Uncharacterized protein n=1 Tax=Colletotrichum phormii TaxID=359342 RepID=A0AAJ0A7C2_9PEZI|nr:uncharacterized protein BDP81DRAFT_11762 [Colletotrichum phormii]KAK1655885.1 hypothetical protein BDP81DRAFT_11762 [Colletotrichum phormii]
MPTRRGMAREGAQKIGNSTKGGRWTIYLGISIRMDLTIADEHTTFDLTTKTTQDNVAIDWLRGGREYPFSPQERSMRVDSSGTANQPGDKQRTSFVPVRASLQRNSGPSRQTEMRLPGFKILLELLFVFRRAQGFGGERCCRRYPLSRGRRCRTRRGGTPLRGTCRTDASAPLASWSGHYCAVGVVSLYRCWTVMVVLRIRGLGCRGSRFWTYSLLTALGVLHDHGRLGTTVRRHFPISGLHGSWTRKLPWYLGFQEDGKVSEYWVVVCQEGGRGSFWVRRTRTRM